MAVGALVRLYARQIKRGMGIGMAVVAGLDIIRGAVWIAVAVGTFGEGIRILHLARGIGVVCLVAEGAFLLVAMP